MPNRVAKHITSLLAAAVLTASATASGVCAILCQQGICCPKPKPSAALPESCCKNKDAASKAAEAPKESAPDCCEVMASRVPNPDATLVKHFEPAFNVFAIVPTPLWIGVALRIEAKPVLGFEEVRGPPDPSFRPDAPRAPPMARV